MIDLTKKLKNNTEITLLSAEEYEAMKEHIPAYKDWWWLRSPVFDQNYVSHVRLDGSVYYGGHHVYYDDGCVRPALKYKILDPVAIGTEFSAFGNRWTVCGKGVAISNGAIELMRFDDNSNDYENSEVKRYLQEWIKK